MDSYEHNCEDNLNIQLHLNSTNSVKNDVSNTENVIITALPFSLLRLFLTHVLGALWEEIVL